MYLQFMVLLLTTMTRLIKVVFHTLPSMCFHSSQLGNIQWIKSEVGVGDSNKYGSDSEGVDRSGDCDGSGVGLELSCIIWKAISNKQA